MDAPVERAPRHRITSASERAAACADTGKDAGYRICRQAANWLDDSRSRKSWHIMSPHGSKQARAATNRHPNPVESADAPGLRDGARHDDGCGGELAVRDGLKSNPDSTRCYPSKKGEDVTGASVNELDTGAPRRRNRHGHMMLCRFETAGLLGASPAT